MKRTPLIGKFVRGKPHPELRSEVDHSGPLLSVDDLDPEIADQNVAERIEVIKKFVGKIPEAMEERLRKVLRKPSRKRGNPKLGHRRSS